MSGTKKCTFCDETIQAKAIKCRYCGSMLSSGPTSSGSLTGLDLAKQALGDRYQILEEIGRGGMATVYKAIQKNLNRPVALKVVHQNLLHDTEFLQRFHREAQLCASLNHPNIVTVHDEGEVDGVHFMAMEYLEGIDLHRMMRSRGKLSPKQTLQCLLPLVRALEYAHNKGYIHRDIKSANIFITDNGRAVLMDFGIAHAAAGTMLTKAGAILGTPEYMSPEQAEGRKIDHRSDLYSLGVVMYECLTGSLPFQGDNAASIIYKVIHESVDSTALQHVPQALIDLNLNLLSKKPSDRPATAGKVAEAMGLIQEEKTLKPKGVGKKRKTKKTRSPDKHNKTSGIIWLLIFIGLGLIGLLVFLHQLEQQPPIVEWIGENDEFYQQQELEEQRQRELAEQHQREEDIRQREKEQRQREEELRRERELEKQRQRELAEQRQREEEQRQRELAEQRQREEEQRRERELDENAWVEAQQVNSIDAYNEYLINFSDGLYVDEASSKINELEKAQRDPFQDQMILVEGGVFSMGCSSEMGDDCDEDEKPVHQVTLSTFKISKYPVTQEEWQLIMGNNPSHFSDCNTCPVENVSWNDVQEFIMILNERTEKNYRLPTEAEWEFAARGGILSRGYKYAGSNGIDLVAWYNENSHGRTHPVGGKFPNELGIFDMNGNVWEWCQDIYGSYNTDSKIDPSGPDSGSRRTRRGGSFHDQSVRCRITARGNWMPDAGNLYIGFRLAVDL